MWQTMDFLFLCFLFLSVDPVPDPAVNLSMNVNYTVGEHNGGGTTEIQGCISSGSDKDGELGLGPFLLRGQGENQSGGPGLKVDAASALKS